MREWWSKLRALVAGRRGMDEDLREEMAAHLEFEIRDDIAKGKSPNAAREAARRRFGNRTQIQELAREAWSFREVETLVQDLRYGGRMLLRNPGFTAVAVLSLALGMGAGTAVFRIADALLLKPFARGESPGIGRVPKNLSGRRRRTPLVQLSLVRALSGIVRGVRRRGGDISGGPCRWRCEPRRQFRFGPAGAGQAGHGELLFSDGRGAARRKSLHP